MKRSLELALMIVALATCMLSAAAAFNGSDGVAVLAVLASICSVATNLGLLYQRHRREAHLQHQRRLEWLLQRSGVRNATDLAHVVSAFSRSGSRRCAADRLKATTDTVGLMLPRALRERRWAAMVEEELNDLRDKSADASRARRYWMTTWTSVRLGVGFLHTVALYLAQPVADVRKLLK